jgi:hypothetical protein
MTDIYGKETEFGNTTILTADGISMNVLGKDAVATGFLVQNITLQYNQPLNRIYEIGSNRVYFAPGRSVGSMQLGRIIGAAPITTLLGESGTGVWTTAGIAAGDRTITLVGTKAGLRVQYKITGAVIESYGFSTDANGILVQENVTIQFASLSF